MKVKIMKVLPFKQNLQKKLYKGQPFNVGKTAYVFSANKFEQKNYTGFPAYIQLFCTFPDQTIQYEYGKFQVTVQLSDYKEIVEKKNQKFEDIKRGQSTRDFVFNFTPTKKGIYKIKLDISYKPKSPNINQHAEQKKQGMQQLIKYEDPFELSELFVTHDNSNSITFPFYVQHTIQNKLTDEEIEFVISFSSETFESKFLNDKNQFKLKTNQIYHSLLSIKPKDVRKLFSQKIQTIGELCIKYAEKGESRKRLSLTSANKLIFFKASTLQKQLPKKDIIEITVRFQKIYNLNFGLGDISLKIDENLMQGIKIVKTSKRKINLQHRLYDEVILSMICLKSGYFCLKGFTLLTQDNRVVNYVNDLTLFVGNELARKATVFENTSVIQINPLEEEESLI